MTRILFVDPGHIDKAVIDEAGTLIRAGELVAFPTETVYGLGANAFNTLAVAKIFAAKGRPGTDPVIVHVGTRDQLAEVTPVISDLATSLIEAFWPGPLTLVLPRGARIPANVSAGLATVAVRVPIAAPSANLFSHTSPTTARHVYDDLHNRIPLILDGGPTPVGVESTIIDLSGTHPRLLRPGGLPLHQIRQFAPDIEIVERRANGDRAENEPMPAPGMRLRHYAPRARLIAYHAEDDGALRSRLRRDADLLMRRGEKVGLLVADEDSGWVAAPGVCIVACGPLADLDLVARRLFASLRELDAVGVTVILARLYPEAGVGMAINDRLTRAAEGRVEVVPPA
jgi:L-threonylcarbamoyladenylate synthase